MADKENKNTNQPGGEDQDQQTGNRTGNTGRAEGEETKIYLNSESTLQTSEEAARDKSIDPRKDDTISVSRDDLNESDADRLAGNDRAGSGEHKDNSI